MEGYGNHTGPKPKYHYPEFSPVTVNAMKRIVTILLIFGFIVGFFSYAVFNGTLITANQQQVGTQGYLSDKNISDGR